MRHTLNNARFILALGGFLGYSLTFFGGLAAGNDITYILFMAAVGCLVGAGLARYFLHVTYEAMNHVLEKRKCEEEQRRDEERRDTEEKRELEEAEALSGLGADYDGKGATAKV